MPVKVFAQEIVTTIPTTKPSVTKTPDVNATKAPVITDTRPTVPQPPVDINNNQQGQPEGGPAPAAGPTQNDQNNTTTNGTSSALYPAVQFFQILLLLIMGGLLGFYYYKNYLLNLRIHRLEVLVEKSGVSPVSQDEPIPFSWDQALKSLEGGWSLFTKENKIFSPGVVCLQTDEGETGFKASVNLIQKMINNQNKAVIYLSRLKGEEDLGRALLDIESGISVKSLSPSEREELVAKYSLEMSKYESGLFIFQNFNITVDDLYDHILKLAEKFEIGLIIIDGKDVIASDNFDDLISKLRLISIKTYIPVIFTDAMQNVEIDKISPDTLDRITALMNLKKGSNDTITFKVHKFQGNPPPEVLKMNPDTGEISGE